MSDQDTNQDTTQNSTPSVPPVVNATIGDVEIQTDNTSQDDGKGRDYVAEIKKLRDEAAKWRTQYRDAQKQVDELSPAAQKLAELEESQKSEEQKLREQLEEMKASTLEAEARAELATKQAKLAQLASKANVNPDLVALLDINKLDFDDENAVIETLKQFSQKPALSGGGPSDPKSPDNTAPNETELVKQYFRKAGSGVTIFGS